MISIIIYKKILQIIQNLRIVVLACNSVPLTDSNKTTFFVEISHTYNLPEAVIASKCALLLDCKNDIGEPKLIAGNILLPAELKICKYPFLQERAQ